MSEFFANIGHAFSYGGVVTVIGLLIVFAGLCILIGFVSLMALYFKRAGSKQQTAPKAREVAPPPALVEPEPVSDEIPGDIIAAIAAAIQAFDGISDKAFTVKSVRRVNGWKQAARAERVYKF